MRNSSISGRVPEKRTPKTQEESNQLYEIVSRGGEVLRFCVTEMMNKKGEKSKKRPKGNKKGLLAGVSFKQRVNRAKKGGTKNVLRNRVTAGQGSHKKGKTSSKVKMIKKKKKSQITEKET